MSVLAQQELFWPMSVDTKKMTILTGVIGDIYLCSKITNECHN